MIIQIRYLAFYLTDSLITSRTGFLTDKPPSLQSVAFEQFVILIYIFSVRFVKICTPVIQ